ncbi:hypothetical protein Gpo141_00012006 [Globisporangium polare]
MELASTHRHVGKLPPSSGGSASSGSSSSGSVHKSSASSPHGSDDPQRLLRSVDSASSLSSTVYDEDEQQPQLHHRPGSAPPNLNFESSTYFNFGSSSNFFMKYDDGLTADEFPEGITSPTGNNDILPPHVISPTNQGSHDERVAMRTTTSAIPVSQGFPVPQHRYNSSSSGGGLAESKVTTNSRQSHVAALSSHRKNSIEMFLSQSPSQSLGGDFLKLSLDDHKMSLERGPGSGGVVGGNAFASGHFTLNPVPESPKKFIRSNSSSHILNHHQQQQELQPPPMMSRSSSASSYNNYQLSPRMGSEDSWHGSQDGGQQSSAAYYQESQEYYAVNGQGLQYENIRTREQQQQPQYHQQQRQQDHGMYRNNQSSYGVGGAGYGGNNGRNQMSSGQGQWNPNIVPSGGAAYNTNGMYMNAPQMQQQQQMHYQQQGPPPGMRGNSGGRGRQNMGNNHGYSRMTPPHSPRKSMHMGMGSSMGMTKQCKFFLQGHCRMGSKCKFAHQPVQNQHHLQLPQHSGLGSRSDSAGLYQQQQLQMSPAHLHQGGLQGAGDEYSHSFARQQQSRSGFRQTDLGSLSGMSSGGSSLNGGLGGGSQSGSGGLGGISAPGLISAVDASGLSAALSVDDIHGRVFAMSKDQNGCRLLQEQLDYEDRQDLCEVIYQESLDHLAEMMVDPFGNYLFQKLLERVTEKKRLAIIRRVSSNLVAAALNLHGTRSVQKVVEVCATSAEVIEDDSSYDDDDLDSDVSAGRRREMNSGVRRTVNLPDIIVEALKDDAVRLCIDSNGNHVIQRALQFMKPEYNQFVFDAVCKECTTVGTHRHGCCVLQRCLDAANKQQKAEVIAQVEKQAMKLMQDPYGNYVVQYVLDSCTAEEAYGVIVKPLGNIFELSIQKFSSNVIEKCLEKAPERVRQNYIKEIINCPKMNKMLQDQFANYVVQRALCVCSEEQCLQLVKSIRPHLACMKNTSGGRRITARILKRFPNMDISMDMGLSPPSDGGMYDNSGGHLQQLSRLPPPAMGYAHQQQQQQQFGQQQQYSHHSTGYGNTGGGYPLAHPHASGHHGMASHGGYSTQPHHQHHHGPSQHGGSGGGGLLNDVVVGSGLGMNAAGTSRA